MRNRNRTLSFTLHRLLCARFHANAEGGAGGGGSADLVEVDLPGGVKVKLPKVEADKVIAGRNELKSRATDAEAAYGRTKAEKEAAEAKAAEAERNRVLAEAAKAGELDRIKDLVTKPLTDELTKLTEKVKVDGLRAAVASHPNIVASAVGDVVDQLKSRVQYDKGTHAVIALDEAGQPVKDSAGAPVKLESFISEFLGKRPHFQRDTTPEGSGATGERKAAPPGQTMTRAQYDAAMAKNDSSTLAGVGSGKIKIAE